MRLDLVRSRRDGRGLEQLLYLLDGEVAHTDTTNLALSDEVLHSFPCFRDGNICQLEAFRDRV